jgi:hypothetical protein
MAAVTIQIKLYRETDGWNELVGRVVGVRSVRRKEWGWVEV